MVTLFKTDCSVRHIFCKIFVSLPVAKILAKHVRNSSYSQVFFEENSHSHGSVLNRYFEEILFVAGERKTNKIYQRKLKLGDRLWSINCLLEIISLRAIILRKTDFAILTVLPCVTS